MFSVYPIPSWWLREYIALSYYHHQIGSMNYYLLFRVRSWNNGMRCISLYILLKENKSKTLFCKHTCISPTTFIHAFCLHLFSICIYCAVTLVTMGSKTFCNSISCRMGGTIISRNGNEKFRFLARCAYAIHYIMGSRHRVSVYVLFCCDYIISSECYLRFIYLHSSGLHHCLVWYLTSVTHDKHYDDVLMGAIASQITSLTIVYSTVYSDADQRKHQTPRHWPLRGEFTGDRVTGLRWPVNSPHKWPVTRKMFSFDDVIMRPNHKHVHILGTCGIKPLSWHKHNNVDVFFTSYPPPSRCFLMDRELLRTC